MLNQRIISVRVIKAFIFLSALLLLNTCSSSIVEPDIPPGRRDYVWTVDTLEAPNNTYYRMWGSNPTDVWCVSPGAWDKSVAHFNGERWSFYGVSGMNVPSSIYGFSNKSVYIGTAGGGVWEFDGSNWKKFAELTKDGRKDIVFDNMWGESSNNFYAIGAYTDDNGNPNNSVIAHFTNKWSILNTNGIIGIVERLYKNKSDDKIFLRTNRFGNGEYHDSTLIYEYAQGEYKQLYSSVWTKDLQADLCLINNEVYFILGNEIARRANNKFQTVIKVGNPNFYQRIWGRSSKDIFLLMTDGLAHYNGSNIEYLFYFNKPNTKPWTQIFGAALFDGEVFFLLYEPSTHLNLIYKGKLR